MIVIDASIAVKWIKTEETDSEKAKAIYNQHMDGTEKIIVPQWFFIEIGNFLVTQSKSSSNHIKKLMDFLFSLNLEIYQVREDDITEAVLLAKQFKTTVYDMLYAVVAKKHKTILITADDRFHRLTQFSYVKLL